MAWYNVSRPRSPLLGMVHHSALTRHHGGLRAWSGSPPEGGQERTPLPGAYDCSAQTAPASAAPSAMRTAQWLPRPSPGASSSWKIGQKASSMPLS